MNKPENESDAELTQESPPVALEHSVRRNTIVLTVSKFFGYAIGLVVTPAVYNALGPGVYGLFAALGSWGATIGAFDFGLSASFLRYITVYIAHNQRRNAGAVASLAIIFFVVLGIVALCVAILIRPSIEVLIKVDAQSRQFVGPCLIYACCFIGFNGICGIPGQILASIHRLDLVAWISLVTQTLGGVLTVVFVQHGYGIYGLFISLYIQQIVNAAISLAVVQRVYGWAFSNPFILSFADIKEMLKYGGWIQLSAITGIVQSQSDKMVIGGLTNLVNVTAYDFGNKIALLSRTFPLSICAASFPAIASIVATNDQKKLSQVYAKSTNALAFVTVLIASFLIASGEYIVRVWIGKPVPNSTAIMSMLVISYSVNNLTGIGTAYFKAVGKPYFETIYGWVSTVINISLTIILGLRFGLMGVVVGTLFGWTSGSIFFIVLFHRITRISWWHSVGWTLAKILAISALTGTVVRYVLYILPFSVYQNRAVGILAIGGVFLLYSFLALLLSQFWLPEISDNLWRIEQIPSKLLSKLGRK